MKQYEDLKPGDVIAARVDMRFILVRPATLRYWSYEIVSASEGGCMVRECGHPDDILLFFTKHHIVDYYVLYTRKL